MPTSVTHLNTGGAWATVANPFGGAPLLQYMTDSDGSTEARPFGYGTLDAIDEPSRYAYVLAVGMFGGETLDEVITNQGWRAAYESASGASFWADVSNILHSGALRPAQPAVAPLQPQASDPTVEPPAAAPVITDTTLRQIAKVQPLTVDTVTNPRPIDPLSLHPADVNVTTPPPATIPSSVTNTASSATTAPQGTVSSAATNTASGTSTPSKSTLVKIGVAAGLAALLAVLLHKRAGS